MRENQQTLTGQPLTSAFRATAHGPLAINANRLIHKWMGNGACSGAETKLVAVLRTFRCLLNGAIAW